MRLGYSIVWGERVTTHPLAPSASWRSTGRPYDATSEDHDEPYRGGGTRHVLVARLGSLGDALLAGPAVRAVAARAQVTRLVWALTGPAPNPKPRCPTQPPQKRHLGEQW